MTLQQLVRDAEHIVDDLPPPMYDRRPVKWMIDLDADGTLLGVTSTASGEKRDRGQVLFVPFTVRTSGVKAILLVDTPVYTLGLPFDDARAAEKHAAYRTLLQECFAQTRHPGMAAVVRFLDTWRRDDLQPSLDTGWEKGDLVTFRVDGALPIDDPAVQNFWAAHCEKEMEGEPGQCLLCGEERRIPTSLPTLIKRIPGGQSSGMALVSINADAFESYHLRSGATARVCADCGERFGKALNHLLASDDGHLVVGPVVYAFWTRKARTFSLASLLKQPDPDAVKALLASYRTGMPFTAIDEEDFYATALTASGGRAVIRDWMETTVGIAAQSLARWFTRLRQVDAYGQPGEPLGVYRLAASLYRDANKEMVAQAPRALVRAALHGEPLPHWLLTQAVNRCRAERTVTYPRAALMKAVLTTSAMEEGAMEQLALSEQRPAYICGRLLAVLEEIQRAAQGKINATLVDRFYGAASTAPASVFGNLLGDAQPHLAKLRKTKPGAYTALQKRLEDVLAPLSARAGFPRTLSLQDQALFSLGYYHQRAYDRAAATARKAAGDTGMMDAIETEEEATNE